MFNSALRLSMPYGVYPERLHERAGWLDRTAQAAVGLVTARRRARVSSWKRFVHRVNEESRHFERISECDVKECADELRVALRSHGFSMIPLCVRSLSFGRWPGESSDAVISTLSSSEARFC